MVPIAEQHSLAIGMFSYRDHMFFGLYADPETLPEVHEMPALLGREITALARPRRRKADGGTSARRAGARYRELGTSSSRSCFAAATMFLSDGSTSS